VLNLCISHSNSRVGGVLRVYNAQLQSQALIMALLARSDVTLCCIMIVKFFYSVYCHQKTSTI
jgi:hypothetical protein